MRSRRTIEPTDPRVIACKRVQEDALALARKMGVTRAAISDWQIVPAERCIEVERHTGVSRFELRPDVYGNPEDGSFLGNALMEARYVLGTKALAEALDVPADEMAGWEKVPAELVRTIEKLTGVSRYRLRPDVFGDAPVTEEAAA